jgi:RNA polymerase sigma factor (sigma-70 family)
MAASADGGVVRKESEVTRLVPASAERNLRAIGTAQGAAILEAASRGEEWAWSLLYQDLAPRVRGLFRANAARHPEDLTGDVFLEVARRIGSFSGDLRGFQAWVFTIAHSRMVDEVRRSARRGEQVSLDQAAELCSGADVEGEVVERLWRQDLLSRATASQCLTLEQRDVLMLRMVGGLSIAETGAALGKSITAVKGLLHRAVRALQKDLAAQGISESAPDRSTS